MSEIPNLDKAKKSSYRDEQLVENEKLIVDDISLTNITFIGYAAIATDELSAAWKIKKLDETAGVLKILWADGDDNYDNVWSNRTTLVYL